MKPFSECQITNGRIVRSAIVGGNQGVLWRRQSIASLF